VLSFWGNKLTGALPAHQSIRAIGLFEWIVERAIPCFNGLDVAWETLTLDFLKKKSKVQGLRAYMKTKDIDTSDITAVPQDDGCWS
jgi:hypothetical protein